MQTKLMRILQKSKWMLITIIAPEILTGKALADLISAAHTFHQTILFEEVREGGRAWTLAHSFFADMGGFEIHFSPGTTLTPGADEREEFGPDTKEKPSVKMYA